MGAGEKKIVSLLIMQFVNTISNEQINELPVCVFGGSIVVVDTPETMAQAESVLSGESILGLDTETRPAFTKGLTYKMALLQVSTADTAFLFRLHAIELSEGIRKILQDDKVLKIGAALRDDIRGLERSQGRMKMKGFIDLQGIVERWGIAEKSVKKMAAVVCGVKVSKAQRLSNWEARSLTESQKQYAAVDAWICREIFIKLNDNKPQ